MSWLRAGLPITLLADLAAPGGPLSGEILAVEAIAADVMAAHRLAGDAPSSRSQGFSDASGA
jgi:hypothetical protein